MVYNPVKAELQAITGIRIGGAGSPSGAERPILKQFSITHTGANGKAKNRTNKGPSFSRGNRRHFRKFSTGAIHISDVVAFSPWGYRSIVAESAQVVR